MKKRFIFPVFLAALLIWGCKRDVETTDYRQAFEGDFPGTCYYYGYQLGQYSLDTGAVVVLVRKRDSTHLTVTITNDSPNYPSFYPSVDVAGKLGSESSSSINYNGGFVGEDSLDFVVGEGHTNYGYSYTVKAHR